jgi:acyl-coenzyme A thioesterase 13
MSAPAGFEPLFRTSPFTEMIGPLLSTGKGKDLETGMHVQEKHCNARGAIHGGVLATLADVALGYTMAFSTDSPGKGIT